MDNTSREQYPDGQLLQRTIPLMDNYDGEQLLWRTIPLRDNSLEDKSLGEQLP